LLDTHALLWLLWGDQHLSSTAREVIDDRENSVFISVASLWEMAIKISLGKLKVDGPFEVAVLDLLAPHFIETLPIGSGHLVDLVDLPHRHRDPFDRLLAAQCRADPLKIVSADKVFDQYGVERIW
jgi:PIN domain nuclease of toxin-antitoxin system